MRDEISGLFSSDSIFEKKKNISLPDSPSRACNEGYVGPYDQAIDITCHTAELSLVSVTTADINTWVRVIQVLAHVK